MGATARQPAGARRGRGDAGVSPVIGMVLILAISVLGIVAVTNWGLPAIDEMNQNVALRGSLDEFRDLQANLDKLMAGTTGQTTVKWQPTIQGGALDVNATSDRWVVSTDVAGGIASLQVYWKDVGDDDNRFTIITTADIANMKLRAWKWTGGAPTELKIVPEGAGAGSCTSWVPANPFLANDPAGTSLRLRVNATSNCGDVNVENIVLSFAVNQEDAVGAVTALHKAFLVDTGHVHWSSIAGARGPRHVFSSNAAVLHGPGGGFIVSGDAPIAPPRNFTNSTGVDSTSIFIRLLKLNGSASFSGGQGGQERFSLYLNLDGTYTMGTADNVTAVYVYVFGELKAGNYDALTKRTSGHWFVKETNYGLDYIVHREGSKPFRFSAVYTFVGATT